MLNQLELPSDMAESLDIVFQQTKKLDSNLTDKRFLQAIIAQWLEQYAQGQEYKLLQKDKVALRNKLKLAIKASGKTQRQIAKETGINYVYLSEVINGKYEPGITVVLLLMRALRIAPARIEKLFYLEPIP